MKIRYYLRGLGLGILFTTVFFLIGGDSKQTMSDEMIKERAKELGMIENTVLADIGNTTVDETVEDDSMEPVETDVVLDESMMETEAYSSDEATTEETVEETAEEGMTEEVEEADVEEETSLEESEAESTSVEEASTETSEENKPADGQMISIVVNKGEGSDTVSQRLYEAGLVDDPYAYDKYLMQNGYDRRIGAGEHMIPSGSSWQEIAQILCS